MPKIIVSSSTDNKDSLRICNGDLVVLHDLVFMVTTRSTDNDAEDERTTKYCSLVDLSTGVRICKEPVSRHTTRDRLYAHLRGRISNYYDSVKPNYSIKNLKIIRSGDYIIEIKPEELI